MIRIFSIALLFTLGFICTLPAAAAYQFQPMVGIPGIGASGDYTLIQLINAIYLFLITMGAIIGVLKIALAGVKYATTDIGGSKSQAKEDIKNVLLGLLILVTPYIVLTAINPGFVKLDVLNLDPLSLPQNVQQTGTNATDGGGTKKQCGSCPAPNKNDPSTPENDTLKCDQYKSDCKGDVLSQVSGGNTVYTCVVFTNGQCPSGAADPTTSFTTSCATTCLDDLSGNETCNWLINACDSIPGRLTKTPESVGRDGEGGTKMGMRYGCMVDPKKAVQCPVKPGTKITTRTCLCQDSSANGYGDCDAGVKECTANGGTVSGPVENTSGINSKDYTCTLPSNVNCPAEFNDS